MRVRVRVCATLFGPLYVCACVGGPLSISKELAQMFNLEGTREVLVRKVKSEEVGLDLVELRFKVQCS